MNKNPSVGTAQGRGFFAKRRSIFARRTDLDLTNGPIFKTILLFALPLILANFVSMLFNAMDLMVLSWFSTGYEVASVGTTSSLTHLLENLATGLCVGVNIVLARLFGEGNKERAQKVISTALIASVGLGGIIAIIGSFISRPFLIATNCPPECIEHATLYATVYFIGMPLLLLYHYAAAIIRVGGDSQRPLYYMLIAGVLNLVLNVIFCLLLKENKVMAVALATALSKGVAAILALRRLSRAEGACRWDIRKTCFDFSSFKTIILFGLPTAITSCLYPIANMQIAAGINSYGANFVAGNTASQQYEQMVASYNVGLSATALTIMGQNLGAKKPKRVYRTFFYVLILEFCLIFGTSAIVCTFGRQLLPIFAGQNPEAIAAGMLRMRIMLFSYCLLHTPLGPAIQAFGYPTLQTAINIAGILGVRTLWMQFVYGNLVPETYPMVLASFPVSYIFTTGCYAICIVVILLRYRKGKYKKKI